MLQRFTVLRRLWAAALCLVLGSAAYAQDFSHPDTEPNPQAELVQKANDALTSGDLPAALDLLTRLNAQSPGNAQVLYNLGTTLEAIADQPPAQGAPPLPPSPLTAEQAYRQSIEANPQFAPPRVALGFLLARDGKASQARTELTAALAAPGIGPTLKARALRALARLDLHTNTSAASSELLDAIRLSPEQPDDVLLSAQIAEAAADFPGAERAYRRYLALPQLAGDFTATTGLVHALIAQHNIAEAQTVLQAALEQHPGDPTLTAQLAQSYLISPDPAAAAQAVPLLEKLHSGNPQDANISRLLARVYLDTGHPDQAEALYAPLIAAAGATPDPTLLDSSADALIRLHRPAEAEKLLRQAIEHPEAFPSRDAMADAAMHLALASSQAGEPTITLQALTLSATVHAPSAASLFLEATAYDSLHQSSKAAELYRQFLSAADGKYPDEEAQVRQRIAQLGHLK